MKQFSHRYIVWVYRLLTTGIIIIGAVPLGLYFYLHSLPPVLIVNVRNFAAELAGITRGDIILVGGDPVKLRHGASNQIVLKKSEISTWVEPYTRAYSGRQDVRISGKLNTYIELISSEFNVSAINARLAFEDGVVTTLTPAQDGLTLDIESSASTVRQAIFRGAKTVNLSFKTVRPAISLETINELGINTLLGIGESDFVGSSPARVKNIKVASAKYNGYIIKPGENFSFNSILGSSDDINAANGYAPEKVIKNKKLVYEYGGGICQVSTTMFRAAVLSGLPILERKPHAFPVRYYNPQGMDATIYPAITDLKFKNDTPGHILIQTRIAGTKIYFELYGASDGRKTTIAGPYQYDVQSDGALKAYFTRTISRENGDKKEDKFYSNYKSPALYPLETPNPLE